MKLSEELVWRGLVNQTTIQDLKQLDTQKWTFYHGFDASADSQTIGNLAGMMLDKVFMRHGHKAILLAGGATSLIGDPGGKDAERPLQDEATVHQNVANAEAQLKRIFAGQDFTLVNNLDWTKDMTLIEFLRDIGKHFSMTPLVQRDYIAKRIGADGSGISYTELSYTLLQGMDFLHLFDAYGCNLQLSGSDQWGNCLSGIELIRKVRGADVHALTMPLIINKATGKKFGKSEEGAVWLDESKTSVFTFYQFWLNMDDEGVADYLKIYTTLSKDEVDQIITEFSQDKAGRSAQKRLAEEVTALVHGPENTKRAQQATAVITGTTHVGDIDETTLTMLRQEIPHASVSGEQPHVADALVTSGLAASNTEARRLLESNSIYINGIQSNKQTFEQNDFKNNRLMLRKGKVLQNSALIERA